MITESRNKKILGFTLVETLVSIAIFSMLLAGILALIPFLFSSANSQSVLLSNNQQATQLVFRIMKELRNANTSITGAYALATANNQQLIFYTDAGATVNRINYFIQNGELRRGVIVPTGSPATYNPANEVVTTVQKDLANDTNPLFYYYSDTYDGDDLPLSQPVNLTQVKFIRINLSVFNRGGKANTNSYTVTAGSAIRNLKTNLGN